MRKPWFLIGGVIVVLVGIAGLVLPVLPGIALLVLGSLMIRSAITGDPIQLPQLRRSQPEPLPEAADG